MARDRALANARAIAQGRDPRRRMQQVPTFANANETAIAIHAENWKSERTEGQWRASMREYVLPCLARKRVDAVTAAASPVSARRGCQRRGWSARPGSERLRLRCNATRHGSGAS